MKFIVKLRRTIVEEAEFVVDADDAAHAEVVAKQPQTLLRVPWGVVSTQSLRVVSVEGGYAPKE